jgi:cysteine desulfurase / selenocysteine lyase
MQIYLDNSATSFPKPPAVLKAMSDYLTNYGASPGRSAHQLSVRAAREVFETRELLAGFFNLDNSERVIFTANATLALNIAIKGLLKKGNHVIISSVEHNSVHRPLRFLEREGIIELSIARCSKEGFIDLEHFKSLFRDNTRLVAIIHGSNAGGAVQPVREIGKICRQKKVVFLLDAAQTAGFLPIDMQEDSIDIVAFTGHKKLYGPPGTGGLCIAENISINTFIHGGSGSNSESDHHPETWPDRLEAGTPNTIGIIGLKAGLEYVMSKGLEKIRKQQFELTGLLIKELSQLDEIELFGPKGIENRLPLVSFRIKGIQPGDVSRLLDQQYGIMTRSGLHCSPLAHRTIGSYPQGTTRISTGTFNTEEEIIFCLQALKDIIHQEITKK